MKWRRIKKWLNRYFGDRRAALAAAVSEVDMCIKYDEYLDAVRREVGLSVPTRLAVFLWAVRRGLVWA